MMAIFIYALAGGSGCGANVTVKTISNQLDKKKKRVFLHLRKFQTYYFQKI